jgi:hypothetical protein
MFCRSLFVLLCFFFWPLFFFDVRILIAPFGTSKLFLNILLITLSLRRLYHSFLTLLSLTHRLNDKVFKCNKKGKKKYITLSEQFKNISHCQNSSKIYHTVRTVQQSNRNIIETEEKSLTLSSCYGYFSSTVKLVLLVQTSPAK